MKTLVLLLGLLTAFGPLSIDMYLPALSVIAQDFGAEIGEVQFSLSSFFIGLALGQVFYGPVTDRWGRKKPLYFGLILYILASAACAKSDSAFGLTIFRFLQALGSCAGMVISRAVVRDKFDARDAAKTFSLLMLIMGIAPILAPSLGSAMMELWGWRSIFWFLSGISSATLVAVYFFLPETHTEDQRVSVRNSLENFPTILKDREFLRYALSGSMAYAGMFAYITGSAFVFMEYFDFSPASYSALFGANAAGIIAASQINGLLLGKWTPHEILKVVYPCLAILGVVLALAGLFAPELELIVAVLFLFLFGMGMLFPNSTASSLASQKRAGSASALLGTLQFGVSAPLSASIGVFHNGTAAPMTVAVGMCALLAYLAYSLIKPKG